MRKDRLTGSMRNRQTTSGTSVNFDNEPRKVSNARLMRAIVAVKSPFCTVTDRNVRAKSSGKTNEERTCNQFIQHSLCLLESRLRFILTSRSIQCLTWEYTMHPPVYMSSQQLWEYRRGHFQRHKLGRLRSKASARTHELPSHRGADILADLVCDASTRLVYVAKRTVNPIPAPTIAIKIAFPYLAWVRTTCCQTYRLNE